MKRSELYALVWAEPIYLLAPRLGRTGRGLAKLCERYKVPVPPRGFWNKKDAGQKLTVSELADPTNEAPIPELRAYNGAGLRAPPHDEPEQWVIPGVLKRSFPDLPASQAFEPEPEALTADRVTSPAAPPRKRTAKPERPSGSSACTEPSASSPEIALNQHAPDVRQAVARRRQYERAIAFAAVRETHRAVDAMLDALESCARERNGAAKSVISDWIQLVRAEMDAADPLRILIEQADAIATGRQQVARH